MTDLVVIIPAFNEEASIGHVLRDLPRGRVLDVLVVDNGSTDRTAERARACGAVVVDEPRRGYGQACLTGIAAAAGREPEIVVFLDGDYSDHPEELDALLAPLDADRADLVIGSRMAGNREPGAMLPQAVVGNRVASVLMRWIWGARFTDLGPFRAIRFDALRRLGMTDRNYGWTIEMQIRAAEAGLRCVEVPVSYRRRIGVSKVTGTLRGTLAASAKILWTIARYAATRGRRTYAPPRRAEIERIEPRAERRG